MSKQTTDKKLVEQEVQSIVQDLKKMQDEVTQSNMGVLATPRMVPSTQQSTTAALMSPPAPSTQSTTATTTVEKVTETKPEPKVQEEKKKDEVVVAAVEEKKTEETKKPEEEKEKVKEEEKKAPEEKEKVKEEKVAVVTEEKKKVEESTTTELFTCCCLDCAFAFYSQHQVLPLRLHLHSLLPFLLPHPLLPPVSTSICPSCIATNTIVHASTEKVQRGSRPFTSYDR